MMRLLVVEYVTGGGLVNSELPVSLVTEAQLMLTAIVTDLLDLKHIHLLVMQDVRLQNNLSHYTCDNFEWVIVPPELGFQSVWHQMIHSVDAVLVIAPETDGVLERLCTDVENTGTLLLNSSSDAIKVVASKLKTYQQLQVENLPVVCTQKLSEAICFTYPIIIKPDDGVGCEATFIIDGQQSFDLLMHSLNKDRFVIQPWVTGQSASLSVIFFDQGAQLLSYNKHLIDIRQGQVHLMACFVGEKTEYWEFYQSMVLQLAGCLPGLRGYVGIDVVETVQGPVIIEINPRLTTSYVGLRKILKINPATLIMQSFEQHSRQSATNFSQTITPIKIEINEAL